MCVLLTLEAAEVEVKYSNVSAIIGAPHDTEAKAKVANGRKILTGFMVRDKIDSCLRRLPRKYRQDWKFQKGKVDETARRIRVYALKVIGFSAKQRQTLFNYIIAACIQQALTQYKMHAPIHEICEAMKIEYVGDARDETFRSTTQSRVGIGRIVLAS
jgi:hypothetical protein